MNTPFLALALALALLGCSPTNSFNDDADASTDVLTDIESDSGDDSGADARPDGTMDAEPDARPDGTVDAEPDAEPDGAVDAGPDGDVDVVDPVDPCGNPDVIPSFEHGDFNPTLVPVSADADQGSDNIYAPEVMRVGPHLCLMWYGGQGSDGHDAIFLATSTDCHHWNDYPSRTNPAPVIDHGSANHVNDPSVILVNGTYYMYYTVAATGEDDRIHRARSADGINWITEGMVLDVGPNGAWDDFKVGRPAALYRGGTYYLYYDGNDGVSRHVGLATSTDGLVFVREPLNPLFFNAGAVDFAYIDGTGVLLFEGQDGTHAATTADGLSFCDQGRILGLSGESWDQYGQVTPFLHSENGSSFDALFFGAASNACWCVNRIAQVYPAGVSPPADPSAGCGGCLVGYSTCTDACRGASASNLDGYCASPGSTNPSACCACVTP